MLLELILDGFGNEEDYNCAEKIFYGANKAYNMGLSKQTLKLVGGFGGGMFIGDKCGAVVASIMVISNFVNDSVAHQSPKLKRLVLEFQERYTAKNDSTMCKPLKENFSTAEFGCLNIIADAARILDEMVERENLC
jgi:C_GCAxxG_C_C family probable redox protein